jgi:hypothetical protein
VQPRVPVIICQWGTEFSVRRALPSEVILSVQSVGSSSALIHSDELDDGFAVFFIASPLGFNYTEQFVYLIILMM